MTLAAPSSPMTLAASGSEPAATSATWPPTPPALYGFVSLLDKIPAQNRSFTDVWQTLPTKQGVFFRSYKSLFRWDGKTMRVWSATKATRFEALSLVRGRIYTAQHGTGLEEVQGDEIRPAPGGETFRDSIKLFLHPYGNSQILISERDGLLSLYDGQKVVPFTTQADSYLKQYRAYTSMLLRDGRICVNNPERWRCRPEP
jgi:hypothetical protein